MQLLDILQCGIQHTEQYGADDLLLIQHAYSVLYSLTVYVLVSTRSCSPGLYKGKQSGRQVEAEDQLALLHIQPLLSNSCRDDNVQLASLHLLQDVVLCLHSQEHFSSNIPNPSSASTHGATPALQYVKGFLHVAKQLM